MSVVLAVENPSAILGFHLGGDDNNYGVGAVLTKSDIVRFKDAFSVSPSHILLPESGTFRQQQYGVNCVIQGVHPNSVAAHMKDGEYKLFGSTGFVGKDSSRVVRTPIDEDVRSICGIKVEWDKPKLEGFGDNPSRKDKWLAWTDSITHTADEVPRDVLDAAVSDYTNGIISYIKHNPPDIMRPLNDFEVVCGVQDVEFIEPLESSTSIGFPLGDPRGNGWSFVKMNLVNGEICLLLTCLWNQQSTLKMLTYIIKEFIRFIRVFQKTLLQKWAKIKLEL
jgi:hypothetical protein